MSLWLTYDAQGRANMVLGATPVAADPWVNGLRYRNTDSALYVQAGPAPLAAPDIGGIARDDAGVMYVLVDTLPSPKYYNSGGVLTDSTGAVSVSTAGAISGSNGGNPVDTNGSIAVGAGGFGPVAIFDAPLTTTLVPLRAGDPTFTFTRATTAYVADNEGILRNVPSGCARFQGARFIRNWCTASENLNGAGWAINGTATKAAGIADPFGGTAAWQINFPAIGDNLYFAATGMVANRTETFSLWIKADAPGTIRMQEGQTGVPVGVLNVTSAWQRFSISGVCTTTSAWLFIDRQAGQLAKIYIYGAQIEDVSGQSNTAPGDYVSAGVLAAPYHGCGVDGCKAFATVNANVVNANVVTEVQGTPIPAATLLGYTAENQSSNLCLQSQTFDNAAWALVNAIVTANTQIAPNGSLTADTFTDDATNGAHEAKNTITAAAGVYTFSVYAKQGTLPWMQMLCYDGITLRFANFNLATGAVGNKETSVTATSSTLPNGWFRFSVSITSAGTQLYNYCYSSNANVASATPAYVGTGQTMYLWGAMVEAASDASSYIATAAVSVTRNFDVLQYSTVGNFAAGLLPGTVYLEGFAFSPSFAASTQTAFNVDPLTGNNRFEIRRYTTNGAEVTYGTGAATLVVPGVSAGINTLNKIGVPYGPLGVSFFQNGVKTGTNATPSNIVLAAGNRFFVGTVSSTANWMGTLRNVRIYDTRLTDVQLQAMTA